MQKKTFNDTNTLLLLLMRVLIGWQFLYEGLVKLFDPSWSAANYLLYSDWILSDIFHLMASDPVALAIVNFCNIWGLILIGLGLIGGILVPVAACAGAFLLLLYYVANPPFTIAESLKEGRYLIVNKDIIEMVALLAIAFIHTPSILDTRRIKTLIQSFKRHVNKVNEQSLPVPAEFGDGEHETGRRNFLFSLVSIPATGLFTWAAIKAKTFTKPLPDAITGATLRQFHFSQLSDLKGELPHAKIGNVDLSRLFIGCNLIGGWAHSRDLIYVPSLVKKYHSRDKVFETLQLAERCGINGIILNTSLTPVMQDYWKETRGKMQFLSDCAFVGDVETGIKVSMDAGAASCYIQGVIMEDLLEKGESFEIAGKWMEMIRSYGVPAGIGAHSLEVIKRCVDTGIKPDYWVKTLHRDNYWSARPEEERHDNNWCEDSEATIRYMNDLEEPWIAFKVLAAGAIEPEDGFRYAFEGGADFICVGMYDFQIVDDVNLASEILHSQLNRLRPWRC